MNTLVLELMSGKPKANTNHLRTGVIAVEAVNELKKTGTKRNSQKMERGKYSESKPSKFAPKN